MMEKKNADNLLAKPFVQIHTDTRFPSSQVKLIRNQDIVYSQTGVYTKISDIGSFKVIQKATRSATISHGHGVAGYM